MKLIQDRDDRFGKEHFNKIWSCEETETKCPECDTELTFLHEGYISELRDTRVYDRQHGARHCKCLICDLEGWVSCTLIFKTSHRENFELYLSTFHRRAKEQEALMKASEERRKAKNLRA
jgi:hypothetical protein